MATSQQAANPFDQFDEAPAAAGGNPFDQFDSKPISGLRSAGQTALGAGKEAIEQVGAFGDMNPVRLATHPSQTRKLLAGVLDAEKGAVNAVQHPIDTAGKIADTVASTWHKVFDTAQTDEDAQQRGRTLVKTLEAVAPVAKPLGALARGTAEAAGSVAMAPINAFRPSVQANRVLVRAAGNADQRAAQAAALRSAPSLDVVAGTADPGPTTAQAVAHIPQGTTLQALQRSVAAQPFNSIAYNERFAGQQAALKAAKAEIDQITAPIREKALGAAKANGGVLTKDILSQLPPSSDPLIAGTPIAGKVMADTRKLLETNTDPATGRINPETLYQFRKAGLGQIIAANAGTDVKASTYAQMNTAKSVQQAIDSAIVKAGGTEWPTYLKTYSEHMKPLDAAEKATDAMYSPAQPTSMGGGAGMPDSPHVPHVLSPKAMAANYGLGLRRRLLEKAVSKHLGETLIDPAATADVLAPR